MSTGFWQSQAQCPCAHVYEWVWPLKSQCRVTLVQMQRCLQCLWFLHFTLSVGAAPCQQYYRSRSSPSFVYSGCIEPQNCWVLRSVLWNLRSQKTIWHKGEKITAIPLNMWVECEPLQSWCWQMRMSKRKRIWAPSLSAGTWSKNYFELWDAGKWLSADFGCSVFFFKRFETEKQFWHLAFSNGFISCCHLKPPMRKC